MDFLLQTLDVALKAEYFADEGPVVQRLEPTAHNGVVVGSNPTGPTTLPKTNLLAFYYLVK
jgi:hypothetical protein